MTLDLQIKNYMYPNPVIISAEMPLGYAIKVMKDGNFRHLPVTKNGKPYSIVTEHEIANVLSYTDDAESIMSKPIEYFSALELISVSPQTSLLSVLDEFLNKKIGAVVVVEENEFIGIFTVVDVCRVLRDIVKLSHNL